MRSPVLSSAMQVFNSHTTLPPARSDANTGWNQLTLAPTTAELPPLNHRTVHPKHMKKKKHYPNLVEREDPIDLLRCNGLRDGDLPLVVVAGDHLRRVAPELVVAEGPAGVEHTRRRRLGTRIWGGEGGGRSRGSGGRAYLQRRSTWTFTAFSLSARDDMAGSATAARGGGGGFGDFEISPVPR